MNSTTHLDDLSLAAFLDGNLPAHERERAVAHLAQCRDCRDEWQQVQRLLRTRRSNTSNSRTAWHGWWRTGVTGIIGTAAAAASLLWFAPFAARQSSTAPVEAPQRHSGTALGQPIDRVRSDSAVPEMDAPLPVVTDSLANRRAPLRLAWHNAGAGASYDLLVQDETGSVLYAISTGDTTLSIPPARLRRPARVYWRVDAQLLDGSTRSSGVHVLHLF